MGEALITRRGGGKVEVKVKNATILPAIGKQNDIVVINANTVTEAMLSNDEPASPVEGMVWLKCGGMSYAYVVFGNMKVYITSAVQYVSGAWVVLGEWYVHDGTQWNRGRVYIFKDGADTGFVTLSKNGGTFYPTENPYRWQGQTGSGAATFNVTCGHYNFAQFSTLSFRCTWSTGGGAQWGFTCGVYIISVGGSIDQAFAASSRSASRTDSTTITTLPITYSDVLCDVLFQAKTEKNGNIGKFQFYDVYLD